MGLLKTLFGENITDYITSRGGRQIHIGEIKDGNLVVTLSKYGIEPEGSRKKYRLLAYRTYDVRLSKDQLSDPRTIEKPIEEHKFIEELCCHLKSASGRYFSNPRQFKKRKGVMGDVEYASKGYGFFIRENDTTFVIEPGSDLYIFLSEHLPPQQLIQ